MPVRKVVYLARYHFEFFSNCCKQNVYTIFLQPRLAVYYLRRDPKPRLKLVTTYFSPQEIARLLLMFASYLSRGLFSLI